MAEGWLSPRAQARAIQLAALHQARLDEARYYAALAQWSASVDGQTMLDHWVQTVLLKPAADDKAVGEQRFLQRVLHDLSVALAKRDVPDEGPYYEPRTDSWWNPAAEWE